MSVQDTLAVLDGRVLHAYHVEGCGGGHAPNVLQLAGRENILASSTNPTLPYGVNAVDEHLDMILLCHGMNPGNDSDVRIARARVRGVTMAAEGRLHDLGVIGVTSSDAQGMGRAGETWWRTFALAAVLAGRDEERPTDDNDRILRYLAKVTINPAMVHGLASEVGRLAPGYLADIVLWRPELFAAKPQLVIKGGFPAWGVTGDPNATIDSAEPLVLGPQYGAHGVVPSDLSVLFSNQAAVAEGPAPVVRRVVPVQQCRSVRSSDLVRNGVVGEVHVADDGSHVEFAGERLGMDPVSSVPISRLHFW
jgi:urease subunit alpha